MDDTLGAPAPAPDLGETSLAPAPAVPFAPPELAVVVPAYNERDNIALLYDNISLALRGTPWEMIVVDDDSPDGTAAEVRRLAALHPNLRCIKRIGRRGLSSACVEGILSTSAPYVAVIDADHQHDERVLPTMLARAKAGAELVVGSRFSGAGSAGEGLSATRLWGSTLATRLSALITGATISDPMSGYFMMRRDRIEQLAPALSPDGFKILLDLIATARRSGRPLSIAEVPYVFRQRHAGESKMNSLIVLQFLGLWFSKLTRGLVPTSFLMFGLIGLTGVAVHLTVLALLTMTFGQTFLVGQITATVVAMTWNFFLNNELTYAGKKLRGPRLWWGLVGFYAICSLGGIANVSVASMIYSSQHATLVAGLAGALMSSVFNYAVTRLLTWR
jgi:dolichol-phosphate mannosyltransferase